MSYLLNLIIEKELRDKIRELTKHVYRLEKVVQRLEVWIWGWNINDAERALSGFKPDYYDLIYVKVNNFLNSVKQNKCFKNVYLLRCSW